MKNLKLLILPLFFINLIYAQPNRSNNWFFGSMAGINFSTGSPLAIPNGAMITNEGCAAVSDTLGNLLFYTDGVTVWNKTNVIMPNGTGLMGDASSTQSAIIISKPGSTNEYYIFTMEELGDPDGFRYSVVNMNLQGGAGDVTAQKNIFINTYMTEKLTAVQQLGTTDFWIATHKWGTNEFYVYSLTNTGLQATPVISNTGIVHSDAQQNYTYGQMKFNVCGNKIALATGYLDTVEVFDFNNTTGVVSNPITLPIGYHDYGVEFSKNSQLLYVTTYNPSATLVQFDLTSGNAATIIASQTVISGTPDMYGLQLGNNGKIYVSRTVSPWLGVIDTPEVVGINCNYIDNGVNLDPNGMGIYSMLGLPALVSSYLRGENFCNVSTSIDEPANNNNLIALYPNPSVDNFTIEFVKATIPESVIIFDESGRKVEQLNLFSSNTKIAFGKSIDPGIYFVEIKNEKGNSFKRIVKL